LVSLPRVGNTPYSYPTPSVQQLFDDLGTHEVFPGHPWQREATKIWVFTQVDPDLNQAVRDGAITTGDDYLAAFQPRYFTINGRSGYFSAHEATDTHLHSTVGHPHLIRNVNVGLWGHSPHVHANHCYRLAIDGAVQDNVVLLDTWTVRPMQRVDMLFPFVQPPDIPPQTWQKVIDGVQEEPFPMDYPMHCHQEVSNTAAGGNYPQGNVTHIVIAGPVDQRAAPGNPPAGYPPQPNFDLHMMPEE
ncbi:MAG: hypothetical protein GX591_15390, partial [Planctomycetes bacterium]|nr:hypothetical protein [Planctomycetota bacterium]